MASSKNEIISLDHIRPKPGNLGEQLSITGSRHLLTAANRPPRSRRRVMVILVAILLAICAIVAVVFITKYVLEYLSDTNTKYIDECNAGSNLCGANANCTNTDGSHICTCREGYTGDGQLCQDINECNDSSHLCGVNANCTNSNGSHDCICKEGYIGDGQSCQDVNECLNGSHSCDVNANCTNTYGSHNCTCKEGYIGDGQSCQADPCYTYQNLSDAGRKSSYTTPIFPMLCDFSLPKGWYRFVGAAGTKMPTTRVPAYRCGTVWSGWLNGAHPTVENGKVLGTVCFSDRSTGCKYLIQISVKNCGSFFIYKLTQPPGCNSRYCGTD